VKAVRLPLRWMPRVLRVVLYHHVSDAACSLVDRLGVTTPRAVFEAHVRRLARDYEIVGLDEVLSGRLPPRPLLITFDDGYRSIAETALPILHRLGLPSVFFVTGDCLQRDSLPLDNLLSHLDASVGLARLGSAVNPEAASPATFAQLLDMVAALPYARRVRLASELADTFGIDQAKVREERMLFLDREDLGRLGAFRCEVGNHTRSHLFGRAIVDEASAHHELVDHARELESLTGAPVRAFSYPYGHRRDATPIVEGALRASGHRAVFLAESRPHVSGSLGRLWNRVTMDGCPAWRVRHELELLPRIRAGRDRLREAARPA
jgi:peptidoglycan/xylan/chitin deacetylase (PgdA/CDA1 family)